MTTVPVRTLEEPMAFTMGEFLRGALIAFLGYPLWGTLLTAIVSVPADPAGVLTWLPVFLLYLVGVAAPWTIGTLVVGLTPAWALGRALRRVSGKGLHVAAFALLGAALGALTLVVALTIGGMPPLTPELFIAHVGAGGLTVVTGWWFTARRALHPRQRARRTQADLDAAVEDRIVESTT
ncbi:hypothetical protein [Microbacterium sp.]|uniref:hypothetical protein n=1 Tax=Microbacterium sp. TaxID=51671 RepID=UPI00373647A6